MQGREDAGKPSQTDRVVEAIMTMISDGTLRPGDRLPIEKALSAQLEVSRGSLREGIRALAVLGVVETRQGDGSYVTALDASRLLSPLGFYAELQASADPSDLFVIRRVLEVESAALAAPRISDDDLAELRSILGRVDRMIEGDLDAVDVDTLIDADTEFHGRIAHATGNAPLEALVRSLGGRTHRARTWRALNERGSIRGAHLEHLAILTELERHDADRARVRMAAHLVEVEDFLTAHPTSAGTSAVRSSQ